MTMTKSPYTTGHHHEKETNRRLRPKEAEKKNGTSETKGEPKRKTTPPCWETNEATNRQRPKEVDTASNVCPGRRRYTYCWWEICFISFYRWKSTILRKYFLYKKKLIHEIHWNSFFSGASYSPSHAAPSASASASAASAPSPSAASSASSASCVKLSSCQVVSCVE